MARKRFLVMARVGDRSLHAGWLRGATPDFDLYLSYYGDQPGRFAGDADHWRERRGPKWPVLAEHLAEEAALVAGYDAVWFPDDDLETDAAAINRLFARFEEHGLSLAQPALTPDSYHSHPFLLREDSARLRLVNFVEVMAPLFRRDALAVLTPTFAQSPSGWGLDHVWPVLLKTADPAAKIGVIDEVAVRHTRPVGGELYRNNPGLSGWADLEKVQALYPDLDLRTHPSDKFITEAVLPPVGLELCLCAHNPRPEILEKTLRSVAAQENAGAAFRLTLVDNASSPPIDDAVLAPLRAAGISARLLREPRPGLQRARLCALRRTAAEWVLWVDDDNELAPDYLRRGREFIAAHPEVGCFGGRLLLPDRLSPSRQVLPFLPYLGIRDLGDEAIIARLPGRGPAEPPGAGAWVRSEVWREYLRLAADRAFFRLGRRGGDGLASGDDACMTGCADRVGLACAYVPSLRLRHHLSPHRFRSLYLLRLMAAYGRSDVLLRRISGREDDASRGRPGVVRLLRALFGMPKATARHGFLFALAKVCHAWGFWGEEGRAG